MFKCVIFAILLSLTGCTNGPAIVGDPTKIIPSEGIAQSLSLQQENTKKLDNLNKDTKDQVGVIKKHSDSAENQVDGLIPVVNTNLKASENLKNIKIDIDGIQTAADKIMSDALRMQDSIASIAKETAAIYSKVKQVQNLEAEISKLSSEKERIKNDAIKDLYSSLKWFFAIGFSTIVVGIFLAIFVNKNLGMAVAGVGLLGLALAAGCVYYLQTIATVAIYIIIGTLLAAGIFVVWHLIRQVRKVDVLHQANVENVNLVQTIKGKLDPYIKEEVFGANGIAKTIQSPTTQELVHKIKGKK